jgi:hypothetical protein
MTSGEKGALVPLVSRLRLLKALEVSIYPHPQDHDRRLESEIRNSALSNTPRALDLPQNIRPVVLAVLLDRPTLLHEVARTGLRDPSGPSHTCNSYKVYSGYQKIS